MAKKRLPQAASSSSTRSTDGKKKETKEEDMIEMATKLRKQREEIEAGMYVCRDVSTIYVDGLRGGGGWILLDDVMRLI